MYRKVSPADVAIVGLLASTRRMVRQMGDDIMAEFTKLDAALEDLSNEITKVADQISGIQVEDRRYRRRSTQPPRRSRVSPPGSTNWSRRRARTRRRSRRPREGRPREEPPTTG